MVIKLGEFEDYIKTGELDLEKTNDLFAKLSEDKQSQWMNQHGLRFKERLTEVYAESMITDYTYIAFQIKLLERGRLWRSDPYKVLPGRPNECYDNCLKMVNNSSMIYMGYGLNRGKKVLPSGQSRPSPTWISHAWLVLKKGMKVLETTPHPWLAYFGIPITSKELTYMFSNGLPTGTPHTTSIDEFKKMYNVNTRASFKR